MLDDAYKLAMKCTQLADVMEVSDINLQFYVICDNFRYFVCSSRYTNPFDQPFCWTTSSSQDGKALIKEISNRRVTLEGGRGTVTVMEDQPSFVSIRVNQVHSAAMYFSTMQLCEFSCVYVKSCWIFFWSILMFYISETEILIVHELICFMFLLSLSVSSSIRVFRTYNGMNGWTMYSKKWDHCHQIFCCLGCKQHPTNGQPGHSTHQPQFHFGSKCLNWPDAHRQALRNS